jgi:hypothetical protein
MAYLHVIQPVLTFGALFLALPFLIRSTSSPVTDISPVGYVRG